MPEAAVNEDGEAGSAEDEIRVAWDGLVPAPTGDVSSAEDGCELQLGVSIPTRADGSHDLAALFLSEHVGHRGSVSEGWRIVREAWAVVLASNWQMKSNAA
jgi:hypothetical protein